MHGFRNTAAPGDVLVVKGNLMLVWRLEGEPGDWLIPVEPAVDEMRRHDVTVTYWPLMARMGVGPDPVIRTNLMRRKALPRVAIKMATLDDEMMAGMRIAVAREMRDRAIEAKWREWAPNTNQPANVWAC